MDFKKKNREDVSRLVSDRQAYISSLELKLERFTQTTSSYLDLKEKLEKLSTSLISAEEKIQGLSWLLKTQNENHQQQIKSLTTRYEDLQTNFSSFSHTSISRPTLNQTAMQVPGQVLKDLQEFVRMNSEQIKNEVEQRLEIIGSKQMVFCKSVENRIEALRGLESSVKENLEVGMMKIAEKAAELQKEFAGKLENSVDLNSERYKELLHKVNMSGSYVVCEELNVIRQKLGRMEEMHKNWQDQEVKREMEVREASQAAWNVENQQRLIEKQFSSFAARLSALGEYSESRFQEGFDTKINHLAGSLKKYVSLQKTLHSKVETLEAHVKMLNRNISEPSRKTPDSDRSTNSAKVHSLKPSPTPRNRSSKVKTSTRSRIDILYDELTQMVN